jgi:hypothetical protein
MTLLAWTSFEHETSGWSFASGFAREAGTGQSGYASLRDGAGQNREAVLGFGSQTHIIIAACFKTAAMTTTSAGILIADSIGTICGQLDFRSDGGFQFWRDNGFTNVSGVQGVGSLQSGIETFIELRILRHVSAGEVEVRVNGDPTPRLIATGVNTAHAGTGDPVSLRLCHNGAWGDTLWSAFTLIKANDAVYPDDFLGHYRYGVLDPNANGANNDLAGSDGNSVDNYLLVDDPAENDGDTTYVQSATVTDKDTYGMENLPSTPLSIVAVCPLIIAKKTDAGTRGVTPVIRSGGTDYQAATEHFLGTSYATYKQAVFEDPDTATAWDETGVNAMEVGVEVTT